MTRALVFVGALCLAGPMTVYVGDGAAAPVANASTPEVVASEGALSATIAGMHPDVLLRDADGHSVLDSGAPISTMQSCGGCHDTAWIVEHSGHAWLGLDEMGSVHSGRPFDTGPGAINRWDPLAYDRVSFAGELDPTVDAAATFTLGLADWLRREGWRHVGGGLATTTHDGRSLLELDATTEPNPYTHVRGTDGAPQPWDWQASGVAEMNCFLCHLEGPADDARRADLREGRFGWAATATLEGTGLVERSDEGWRYLADAFGPEGKLSHEELPLQAPENDNCGLCHGAVVGRPDEPFWLAPGQANRRTLATGEIVAPGRISRSGMNVEGRDQLARAWDVHAERLMDCADCHASTNDPAHFTKTTTSTPSHLRFDARTLDISAYLKRPSHDFAKGDTAHGTMRDALDNSMRRCEDCHDASAAHEWLPYPERHLSGLQCESCHVPQTYAPALRTADWTVLDSEGEPRREMRGVQGDVDDPLSLVQGYRPVLLPRTDENGQRRLAPHNLVSTWYWFDAATRQPVTREQLEAAWFEDLATKTVAPSILAALDATGNGTIDPVELGLYEDFQIDAVRGRLRAVGVQQPEIRAEMQPYGLHHGVAPGAWATRDCQTCHGEASRTGEEFLLAENAPGGVLPTLVGDAGVELAGAVTTTACGHVVYRPDPTQAGLYLFGFERHRWVDVVGVAALLLVIAGVMLHGGLRLVLAAARRQREAERAAREGAPRPVTGGRLEPETENA